MFYIGLYRENMIKSSCHKNPDIRYVASPSGPLLSLSNLGPWGQNGPALRFTCYIVIENMKKIFLS